MTGRSRTHVRFLSSLLEHFSSQGAHGAPARSGAGQGAPASDEPGLGAEPRQNPASDEPGFGAEPRQQ